MKTTENKELQNKYITVEQAKELCIEAHKGQWRRPEILNKTLDEKYGSQIEYMGHANMKSMELSDGAFTKEENGNFYIQQPYSVHPIAVAETMTTDEEKIVAYLHDVFEDCDGYGLGRVMDNSRFYIINRNDMEELNISERIYDALVLLTKEKGCSYKLYLENIVDSHKHYDNSLALKVKIADMFNNLSDNPSEKQKIKYNKGLKILLGAL